MNTIGLGNPGGIFAGISEFATAHPFLSMIGVGAGMSLLTSLISGMGSAGSGGSGSAPYTTSSCATQYYYTSDTNALSDPCAIYNPNATTQTPTNTTPTNTTPDCTVNDLIGRNCPIGETAQASGTGAGGCTIWQCVANAATPTTQQCPITINVGCSAGFVAQAQSGTDSNGCPLPVACVPDTSTPTSNSTIALGTSNPLDVGNTPPASTTDLGSSTPLDAGTADTGTPVSVSDILASDQNYTNVTNVNTPTPDQTPLNQNPIPVPQNGLHGDLLSFGGGATIYATSRTNNTEVAGFFGSNSTAASLCQKRPWAQNFISYIIPPAFFDNLCSWAGHPVGAVQPGGAATSGNPQSVSVPGPATAAPTYDNTVQSSAKIWARPASVSLGGRTTVFWTSQDVTSCTESSSDGNFSGSSTSGGASTVALSGPVTFSITCNTVNGTSVSDATTVTIGI